MKSVHISVTPVRAREKKMLKSSKFMNCRESFRMLQSVQERRKLTFNKPYLSLNKFSMFRKSLISLKVENHLNNDLYISQSTLLCIHYFRRQLQRVAALYFLVAVLVSSSFSYSCQIYYNEKNSDYKIDVIFITKIFRSLDLGSLENFFLLIEL